MNCRKPSAEKFAGWKFAVKIPAENKPNFNSIRKAPQKGAFLIETPFRDWPNLQTDTRGRFANCENASPIKKLISQAAKASRKAKRSFRKSRKALLYANGGFANGGRFPGGERKISRMAKVAECHANELSLQKPNSRLL